MALSVQPTPPTPNITSVNGQPTKAAFYEQIASAPASTPNSAFYNNPYGVSAQEIDGMQRQNPYVAPASSTGGSSGSTAPAVNPYTAAFQASIPQQLNAIDTGEAASASNAYAGLSSGIGDLVANLSKEQNSVNQQQVQNELAKQQGTAGVLTMIQHGLQSGGITLANDNASDSSAGDALARAYGILGRTAQSQVGDQYVQGQNAVNTAQQNEQIDLNTGVNDIKSQKTQAINSIVTDASNKLQYLAAQAASASLPDAINIQQQMDTVRQQATAALGGLDAILSQQTGAITPMSQADAESKAATLNTGGTAAAAPFDYTTVGPAQIQQSGPSAAQLPIYVAPSVQKQNQT